MFSLIDAFVLLAIVIVLPYIIVSDLQESEDE